MSSLVDHDFQFPGQTSVYKGKVRDVYTINSDFILMVASDRLSAFDVVLPQGIPHKGQVLNEMAKYFFESTADIVSNWHIASPDPVVTFGRKAVPFKVEMVIRGYLSGHASRVYSQGERNLCGVSMPNGLKEDDEFPEPIITPTTKESIGAHDQDISRESILSKGIVSKDDYDQLESYTKKLFSRGQEMATKRGLILVDTKYEFGKLKDGTIILIDEIHTPDSSRYFLKDGYHERQKEGVSQKQLSKEFVRQFLISHGFQGEDGQDVPELSSDWIKSVSSRYIELYEKMTGNSFTPAESSDIPARIENNVRNFLSQI
ncbi:MAG: phosphoribosylaminoimidazolesuccinocarboxamide synthase [Schleiferiaceae bacterium]|jgi:phosphoribosylaminoimidazole-succinocarboxamide synthase|nr:phosphoribosylaminoimidazolesuccinocarboxamide synthase [Schleiferiaceae bacterium]MDG1881690.1 phosphoribosylaminoimidazolesuccinocarboxamide synthase [Schleiferiaceae bacterium]|tara:strand:- start:2553 stop:3503 length:951 start_codon:yes stop_codon:yes gene_type:complete